MKKLLIKALGDTGDYMFACIQPAAKRLGLELVRIPEEYYGPASSLAMQGESIDYIGRELKIAYSLEIAFINSFSREECVGFLYFADWAFMGCLRASAMYLAVKHPVIFWTFEDPNHFSGFLNDAIDADVICTSAEECVTRYEKHYPNKVILGAPNACSPDMYPPNQENFWDREFDVVFVGNRYPDQPVRNDGERAVIFPAIEWAQARNKKVGIFGIGSDSGYSWRGTRIWKDDQGRVPYGDEDLECRDRNSEYAGVFQYSTLRLGSSSVYRNAKVVLSLGLNGDSLTMCPDRFLQATCAGNIVISYSSIAASYLSDKKTNISTCPEQTKEHLDNIFYGNGEAYLQRAEQASDYIIENYSFERRLVDILEAVGGIWKDF